jgi:hypothetical protein
MSSANQIYVMSFGESRYNFLTKGEADSSIVLSPSLDFFVGVRPEKITEETCVWDISGSHDSLDLVETAQLWGEPSMHAEDLFVNNGCNGQAIEAVSESFPQFDVVSSLALIVEAINTVDGGALVVSSQQEEVLRVLDFVSQQ